MLLLSAPFPRTHRHTGALVFVLPKPDSGSRSQMMLLPRLLNSWAVRGSLGMTLSHTWFLGVWGPFVLVCVHTCMSSPRTAWCGVVWCGVAETLSACSLFPLFVSEAGVLTGQQA